MRRRRALAALGILAALAACGRPAPPVAAPAVGGTTLNDVHSRLNATVVAEVATPATLPELQQVVARAAREGRAISISGGRHAMGGQQFAAGALHVDMSRLDRIVSLDRERGVVTVEAGMRWPALIDALLAMQPGDPQPWTIVQKQTGADDLSIGGALAANIHGRGLTLPPFVADVEGFRLLRADGTVIPVSRESNRELFDLVAGGYGLFGVVTTVDLRLQRRTRLRRDVEVIDVDRLIARLDERIASGARFGDFQFKTDEKAPDFMTTGVLSTYTPVPPDTAAAADQRSLAPEEWNSLYVLAHLDKARAFAAYRDYYLGTSGQTYWSDTHQLSYYGDFESALRSAAPNTPAGSLMITEVCVPRARLADLMKALAGDFRSNGTNLIYGTVRLIERDTDTFLPWATGDRACVVMNLRVTHDAAGLDKARGEFQRVIDRSLERGGTFYLTYHRWARREQLLQAYPRFVEFLHEKRRHDPDERFQSEWYRHYREMFAEELELASR